MLRRRNYHIDQCDEIARWIELRPMAELQPSRNPYTSKCPESCQIRQQKGDFNMIIGSPYIFYDGHSQFFRNFPAWEGSPYLISSKTYYNINFKNLKVLLTNKAIKASEAFFQHPNSIFPSLVVYHINWMTAPVDLITRIQQRLDFECMLHNIPNCDHCEWNRDDLDENNTILLNIKGYCSNS